MLDFHTCANTRVKQYLLRNSSSKDREAIKIFFAVLKNQDLNKARIAALIRGSKNLSYLIDSLSQDYLRSTK